MRGTTASSGSRRPAARCSGTFTRWSTSSSRKARPTPAPRLKIATPTRNIGRLDLYGSCGSTASWENFTGFTWLSFSSRNSRSFDCMSATVWAFLSRSRTNER